MILVSEYKLKNNLNLKRIFKKNIVSWSTNYQQPQNLKNCILEGLDNMINYVKWFILFLWFFLLKVNNRYYLQTKSLHVVAERLIKFLI